MDQITKDKLIDQWSALCDQLILATEEARKARGEIVKIFSGKDAVAGVNPKPSLIDRADLLEGEVEKIRSKMDEILNMLDELEG